MKDKITVSLSESLLIDIDDKRGLVKRSPYIEELLKTALKLLDGNMVASVSCVCPLCDHEITVDDATVNSIEE